MAPNTDITDLLVRYIANEADEQDRARVEAWAAADPDHAAELERMRQLWQWAGNGTEAPEPDLDAAWQRLAARIDAPAKVRVLPIRRKLPAVWWAAAATLVGAALLIGIRRSAEPSNNYMANDVSVRSWLADSTQLELAPGSQATVRYGATRTVQLNGQAYFAVVSDPDRPFQVEVADLQVTVLGTAFTVDGYDSAQVVTVGVRSGRVAVAAADTLLLLTAGEHVRFDRSTRLLERVPVPPMVSFGEKVLHFERARIGDVLARLDAVHGTRTVVADTLQLDCSLTATFEDEPMDRILQVIAETFGWQLERTAIDRFRLKGDGC